MDNSVVVSILCLAYNHEKYIRKTLDGFLNQKTTFAFEVIVHDDASTDNTAAIIRQYEEKYPDIIKGIFQSQNQYSKGIHIEKEYMFPMARGKYIAYCEGDDYWCDDEKLEKQVNILEHYPECSICTHLVQHIQEDGTPTNKSYPAFCMEEGVVPKEKVLSYIIKDRIFLFQISSFLVRKKDYIEYMIEYPMFLQKSAVGDTPLLLYMMTKGNLYYLNVAGSCYRLFSNGSWTSRNVRSKEGWINFYNKKIECMKEYNIYTEFKYNKMIETYITYYEMEVLVLTHNYKNMLLPKYRAEYKSRYSFKERCAIALFSVFPGIERLYYMKKGKKNE